MSKPEQDDDTAHKVSLVTDSNSMKLIAFDKKHRVNYSDETAKTIHQDMARIMGDLVTKIEQIEPVFKGKLLPSGSFHNQTKVGNPDEMDFGFHWDLSKSRFPMIKEVIFDRVHPGSEGKEGEESIRLLNGVDMHVYLNRSYGGYFAAQRSSHGDQRFNWEPTDVSVGERGYMVRRLLPVFRRVSDAAMENVILPSGWAHGGYYHPHYGGHRPSGPSTMFQFVYKNPNAKEPLPVTVDFVLLVEMRECCDVDVLECCAAISMTPRWLYEYMDMHGYYEQIWLKLYDGCFVDHSLAIRRWLKKFDMDSPLKIVIRVMKSLSALAFERPTKDKLKAGFSRGYDDMASRSPKIIWKRLQKYKTTMEEKVEHQTDKRANLFGLTLSQMQWHDIREPEGLRFSDLGEQVGFPPYVKSYTVLSLLVTLFAAKSVENPGLEPSMIWTLNDVDSVVSQSLDLMLQSSQTEVAASISVNGERSSWEWSSSGVYTQKALIDHISRMICLKHKLCDT